MNAVPIADTTSDGICSIRFRCKGKEYDFSHRSLFAMLGFRFGLHLIELERVISESDKLLGLVVVLGDFNAHLAGVSKNVQGVLLQEVMERGELSFFRLFGFGS